MLLPTKVYVRTPLVPNSHLHFPMLSFATEDRFTRTVLTIDSGISREIIRGMAAELQTRYSEPQRYYHTLQHISYMLKALDSTDRGTEMIELAIWFHDCIYDPVKGGPSNERESILVWEQFVESTLSSDMAILKEPVSALIEATISHRLPEVLPKRLSPLEVAIFLDLDMSILADSPPIYEEYSKQIQEEYSHYPIGIYRIGRAKVLEGFLLHERIFLGPESEDMEQRARRNIQGEINRLTQDN
ncbi:hypothetical protein C8R47DRAFT_310108 [Mycena vitilis]|nr:hypothetical protein C8R47DRAFT_310108 [Mycena vitilis]